MGLSAQGFWWKWCGRWRGHGCKVVDSKDSIRCLHVIYTRPHKFDAASAKAEAQVLVAELATASETTAAAALQNDHFLRSIGMMLCKGCGSCAGQHGWLEIENFHRAWIRWPTPPKGGIGPMREKAVRVPVINRGAQNPGWMLRNQYPAEDSQTASRCPLSSCRSLYTGSGAQPWCVS